MSKKKIAVLGSGIGSLSAVYGITNTPNWQDKYDITVYQLGWRVGGKGASGRNAEFGERIEEHGLHIWFGFYENSFRIMQNCYKALNREKTAPLATWDRAFRQHNFITLKDFDGEWKNWPMPFPPQDGIPGIGGRQFWPLKYVREIIKWIIGQFKSIPLANLVIKDFEEVKKFSDRVESFFEKAEKEYTPIKEINDFFTNLKSKIEGKIDKEKEHLGEKFISSLKEIIDSIDDKIEKRFLDSLNESDKDKLNEYIKGSRDIPSFGHDKSHPIYFAKHYKELFELINMFFDFFKKLIENVICTDEIRRIFILIELAIAAAKGIVFDGVWLKGFDVINDKDFREWLSDNGASDTAIYSAPVRAYYDLAFAYEHGDVGEANPSKKGNSAAGVALHSILLIGFAYKGSVMWKMQAGMGDVVFTPIYEVLKKEGVKFKFFHKITELIPNSDGNGIEKIVLNRQVNLKDKDGEYYPLVDVKGLPSWPSEPLYNQIVEGKQLKAENINLESYWTPWKDVEVGIELKNGVEFDEVICGIPISALKLLSPKLADSSISWKNMVDNVASVRTLAMQTWSSDNLDELGWPLPNTILDAYVQPFNTWANMNQTIRFEDWTPNLEPYNISYFCGPMADGANPFPPPSEHNYPQKKLDEIKAEALKWMEENIKLLWPYAVKDGEINWSIFIDQNEAKGVDRFWAQYFRVNIDPTERYTLSLKNSIKYRLTPSGSDFKNLYLAGDWVDNQFLNVGCIESTVISGMRAAEALTGEKLDIVT